MEDRSSILGRGWNLHYHEKTKSRFPRLLSSEYASSFPENCTPCFLVRLRDNSDRDKFTFSRSGRVTSSSHVAASSVGYLVRIPLNRVLVGTQGNRMKEVVRQADKETKARLFIGFQGWSLSESSQKETVCGTQSSVRGSVT
jgi:hypothetical protein